MHLCDSSLPQPESTLLSLRNGGEGHNKQPDLRGMENSTTISKEATEASVGWFGGTEWVSRSEAIVEEADALRCGEEAPGWTLWAWMMLMLWMG